MPVHAITLNHREGSRSPESQSASALLRAAGVEIADLVADTGYLLEGDLDQAALERATHVLSDPVLEEAKVTLSTITAPKAGTQVVVHRRDGVMDPVEASVLKALRNAAVEVDAVKRAHIYHTPQKLNAEHIANLSKILANDVIDEVRVGDASFETLIIDQPYNFKRIDVAIRDLDDAGLADLNKKMSLSLNSAELSTLRSFFQELGREPSDVELEMVAQTWSEHCKHKTLVGPVEYSEQGITNDSLFELADRVVPKDGKINGLLQSTIKRATDELDRPFCLSVFVDNAGIIEFDDTSGVCIKVETHNHPSAIEPYGGAGTGIGGVIRDILGTGLGAKPIMNTDVFCVGYLDMDRKGVPKGALHPTTTLRGIVSGVRDYGNRMGIPTCNGAVYFDERYTGNPLVYAGCVGLMPKKSVHKEANPGDKIVVIGGRTGRDGIGGATFSSAELTEESEVVSSGAVQVGNAITEKSALDVLLKARDEELYTDLTDCGAGGLSSAVGEMGEKQGAHVELSGVPLKYQGLSYREIWLSEAQERMVFAVPPANLDRFLEICHDEDVETAVIGEISGDKQMKVNYEGNLVLDMPMSFLHDGLPKVQRKAVWAGPTLTPNTRHAKKDLSAGDALKAILRSPNVSSKEWIIRQYDHEVQAMSAVKPLSGVFRDGPSDASAVIPKRESDKAVVVGCGFNPHFSDIDPYWMAHAAIDEAIRNVVCTGGNVDHTAILDNFSWGNCDKPDRLGAMVRACAACYDAAKDFGTPFISGKDSLNNEFASEQGTIAIPHTLLITAMSVSTRSQLTTMDLKQAGNTLFMIGSTAREMGGSHYNFVSGEESLDVPRSSPQEALKLYRALNKAQAAGLVRSAHDCSEGGLAVTLAEMCFAGALGAEITLTPELASSADAQDDTVLLYSESNARIVIEVDPTKEAELRTIFEGLSLTKLGSVNDSTQLSIHGIGGQQLLTENIEELRNAWKTTLYDSMGEKVPALVG